MTQNKGCTDHGACVVCPGDDADAQAVFEKVTTTKFSHLHLYVSPTCHHFEQVDPKLRVGNSNAVLKDMHVHATNNVNIQASYATFSDISIEAPTVSLSGMTALGSCVVKTAKLTASDLTFLTAHKALVLHDSPNIHAKISHLNSAIGPAIGAINCNQGTLDISDCKTQAHANEPNSFIIVQNADLDASSLAIKLRGNECKRWQIIDTAHEVNLFSKEYEVRYFNQGFYKRHEGIGTDYLLVTCIVIAVLLLLLPLLHNALWNTLLGIIGKKHESHAHID